MDAPDAAKTRALTYLKRRGTEAPPATLQAQVAAALQGLEAQLLAVPVVAGVSRPGAGPWSPQEILAHLVVSHDPTIEQLRCLLCGDSVSTGPVPADLLPPTATTRPWEAWTADLARIHDGLFELLRSANEETPMTGRGPVTMVIKASDGERLSWVELLDWRAYAQTLWAHTLEHGAQLRKTLEALASSGESRASVSESG